MLCIKIFMCLQVLDFATTIAGFKTGANRGESHSPLGDADSRGTGLGCGSVETPRLHAGRNLLLVKTAQFPTKDELLVCGSSHLEFRTAYSFLEIAPGLKSVRSLHS